VKSPIPSKDQFFTSFGDLSKSYSLPEQLTFLVDDVPHPLCLLAAEKLQHYLINQNEWQHNFGLSEEFKGAVIGKMFGVLVVKTQQNEVGYLAAFSGKLGGVNDHIKFVPPIFDGLSEHGFLNLGMEKLTRINQEIKQLEELKPDKHEAQITLLKIARRKHSTTLQKEVFNQYHFLNQAGTLKSLNEIFKNASYKNPPSGAGECAAPKLLQYAFQHHMKPLAMAEFWWGLSPKSSYWKHGHFYPSCIEKCKPILAHMLAEIDI
jgi:tRNA pseudouridine32 synthase/23S rRNA pseudouridine746 synthase